MYHTPPHAWIRLRLEHLVLLFLLACTCNGCSGSRWVPVASVAQPSTTTLARQPTYVWPTDQRDMVGPGTLVTISSADRKLNGTFRVELDGTLRLPHDQLVAAQGISFHTMQSRIQEMYQHYFRSPADLQVKVTKEAVLIDVQGLVSKPGQYSVAETASLDEIIAHSGGLQDHSGTEKVRFLQIKGPHGSGIIALSEYHSGRNVIAPRWTGGERLFFQTSASNVADAAAHSSQVVRVIGQVRSPAEFQAQPDATFFSYLLQAGGPTDRADLGHITLIRNTSSQTLVRNFNSQSVSDIPAIEPGDTILVNADVATPVEKTTRVATSIASVLASLSILAITAL